MTIQLSKTTTADLAKFLVENPGSIYIGRGRGSHLGNPFSVYSDGTDVRQQSCAAYADYLQLVVIDNTEPRDAAITMLSKHNVEMAAAWEAPTAKEVQADMKTLVAMHSITNPNLVCFCCNMNIEPGTLNTLMCHGESIAQAVFYLASQ